MEFDLPRGLHELGHEPAVRVAELAVPTLLARVRRRRTARRTTIGATATCLVLAAGAAGLVLADHQQSVDVPAVPTPTGSTVPTTAPAPSPAGDATLPFGACGSLVDATTDPPRDSRLALDVSTGSAQAHQSDLVEVSAQPRVVEADVAAGFYPSTGPEFIVTRDGVAVAVAALYPSTYAGDLTPFTAEDPLLTLTTFSAHLRLTACGTGTGAAAGGQDLPPGHYELYAAMESYLYRGEPAGMSGLLTGEVTADQVLAANPADHVTTVSEAVPLEILAGEGPVTGADPAAVTLPGLPAPGIGTDCDPELPQLSDAGGSLPITPITEPQVVSVALPSPVEVTVTYRGAGRLRLAPLGSALILVQDGAVVAQVGGYTVGAGAVDLDLGTTVEQSVSVTEAQVCSGGSVAAGTLAPGTYQAYPTAALGLERLVPPDASTAVPGIAGDYLLVGAPFVLTVTP